MPASLPIVQPDPLLSSEVRPPRARRNRHPQLRCRDLAALAVVRRDRLWTLDDFADQFGDLFARRRLRVLIARGLLTADFPALNHPLRDLVGITNAGERALRDAGWIAGCTGTWNDGNRALSDPRHILEVKDAMRALRADVLAQQSIELREDEECVRERIMPHEARRLRAPGFDKLLEADRTFALGFEVVQTVKKKEAWVWRDRQCFFEYDRNSETLTRGASADDCEYLASKLERYAAYFCAKRQREQFGNESGTAVFVLAGCEQKRIENIAALADKIQNGRAPNRFLFTTAERWLAGPLSALLWNAKMQRVGLVS